MAEEKKMPLVDPWTIVEYPLLTEKSIGMVERQNKMIFIVRRTANKSQIKWAVETALSVKVKSVKTQIDQKGRKKAYVQLAPEFSAMDIATKFGML